MKMKFLQALCLLLMMFVVNQGNAGPSTVLDSIIQQEIDPYEYIRGEDYKIKREMIREELVNKFRLMVSQNQYGHFFEYLVFAVEIADKRYIKLLNTIEQSKHSLGGENIVGYSKLIKAKATGTPSEIIIEEIVTDKMGSFLLADVFAYLISSNAKFENKLIIFKQVSAKVGYKYEHVIYGVLESLCVENKELTSSFLLKNTELQKHLIFDCNNIKEAP